MSSFFAELDNEDMLNSTVDKKIKELDKRVSRLEEQHSADTEESVVPPTHHVRNGADLRRVRIGMGMTVKDVADAIGARDRQCVYDWETRGIKPSAKYAVKLAEALDFDLYEFLGV